MDEDQITGKSSSRLFEFRAVEKKRLVISLTITLVVMVLEILGGIFTFSIALISDASHMFTHAFAIGLSLLAIVIAKKPACHHKTFGLYRAEVLAAFINGLFLLPIIGFIVYEAIIRFLNPQEIVSFYMLIVALIGLGVNISSILILKGSRSSNIGVKSVFYHMIADAASSIGIVIVAIIISFTGWSFLDPFVSIGISAVIFYWAYGILRDSVRILLEMTPSGLNIDDISEDLKTKFSKISEILHVHLWTITPDMLVFSAHLKLRTCENLNEQETLISDISEYLSTKYNILESTIQTVCSENLLSCNF
ncbi:MAG: cation transporter [Candidatus Lokiarchaeota archaeon]|nr:cation transporter [Candidatus Lokiarchaeota archaeon]